MRAFWQASAFEGAYFRAKAGCGLLVGTDVHPCIGACHVQSLESLGTVPAQGGTVTFSDSGITATVGCHFYFKTHDWLPGDWHDSRF